MAFIPLTPQQIATREDSRRKNRILEKYRQGHRHNHTVTPTNSFETQLWSFAHWHKDYAWRASYKARMALAGDWLRVQSNTACIPKAFLE